jgi:hypothetical protein
MQDVTESFTTVFSKLSSEELDYIVKNKNDDVKILEFLSKHQLTQACEEAINTGIIFVQKTNFYNMSEDSKQEVFKGVRLINSVNMNRQRRSSSAELAYERCLSEYNNKIYEIDQDAILTESLCLASLALAPPVSIASAALCLAGALIIREIAADRAHDQFIDCLSWYIQTNG